VEEIDGRGIGDTMADKQLFGLLLEGGKGRSEREGLQVHVGTLSPLVKKRSRAPDCGNWRGSPQQSTMQRGFGDIWAICGNKIARHRRVSRSGAPRPMKMGTIVSPVAL
jgi:hypothetical protein